MSALSHLNAYRRLSALIITVSALSLIVFTALSILNVDDTQRLDEMTTIAGLSLTLLIASVAAWHGSRIAAIALFIITGIIAFSIGTPSLLQVALIIGTLILCGLILWHIQKHRQFIASSETTTVGKPWLRWTGKGLLALLLPLAAVGAVADRADISASVIAARDIPYDQWVWMSENDILYDNETVELFYSEGLFSIAEGGNILTNRFVGSWITEDGALKTYWQRLGEICSIDQISAGSALEDAMYQINGPGEDNWLRVVLSVSNNGHKRFLRRLKVLNERKMHPVTKSACENGVELDRTKIARANGIKTGFVTGARVTPKQRKWLRDQSYLTRGEKILQFYSYGEYDISPGGTLLTDTHFGGWYDSNGSQYSNWAKMGEICAIDRVNKDDDSDTPMFLLTYGERDWLRFQMPKAAEQTLIPRVLNMNKDAQTDAQKSLCTMNKGPAKDDGA